MQIIVIICHREEFIGHMFPIEKEIWEIKCNVEGVMEHGGIGGVDASGKWN